MSTITLDDMWGALDDRQKQEAAEAFWTCSIDKKIVGDRPAVTSTLARAFNFRQQSVERARLEDKSKWLVKKLGIAELRPKRELLIRAWLLARHGDMIQAFLDAMSISHDRGMIRDEAAPPTPTTLASAVRMIVDKFPGIGVAEYLAYLTVYPIDVLGKLNAALQAEGVSVAALLGVGADSSLRSTAPRTEEAPPPAATADTKAIRSDEFTTLDNLVIRVIVGTAFQEQGALAPDQLEDLVDEIVELNAPRHRTLFHRGFLHAVLGKSLTFHFPGENESRRLWYFAGVVMGLLRSGHPERCVTLIEEQPKLAKAASENTALPCGALMIPHLYRPLIEAGKLGRACNWVTNQIETLAAEQRSLLLLDVQEDGERLLRSGKEAEAKLLLDTVHDIVESGVALDADFKQFLDRQNARRRAQLLQWRGNFGAAGELFRQVAATAAPTDAARAWGDLGLVEAGIRKLEGAVPRATIAANKELCAALRRGRQSFEQAVSIDPLAAIKGHFCIAVLSLVGPTEDPANAAAHFRQALDAMLGRQDAYRESGLIDWCRFCLGIALLESLDEAELHTASDLLGHCSRDPARFPMYLWERAVQAAATYSDHTLAERLCTDLLNNSQSGAHELLASARLHDRSPAMRARYTEWLISGEPSIDRQWTGLRTIVAQGLAAGDVEVARRALDELEGIALVLEPCRRELLAALEQPGSYSPAWDVDEAEAARVRLFELDGMYELSAGLLVARFHRLRQAGTPYHLNQAWQVLEQLEGYRLDSVDSRRLRRLIEEPSPHEANEAASLLVSGERVRILYVGGNETQRNYEASLRQELSEKYPGLELFFLFPGWSSNWNEPLDDIRRRIPFLDAVVLSTLVRTLFGRHIRALCNDRCPWFACTGRGRQSLYNSIERAAQYVASRKRE